MLMLVCLVFNGVTETLGPGVISRGAQRGGAFLVKIPVSFGEGSAALNFFKFCINLAF